MKQYKRKSHSLWESFGYALSGLIGAIKSERNLRIHLVAVVMVTCTGAYLSLTPMEWVVLALTMGMVLAAELMNTAIEAAVDLACSQRHPLAAAAKNAAAAAVLVTAITAISVAWLMLWPKLRVALAGS